MPGISDRGVVIAGLVATLGVLVTGIGEFLMHFAPDGFTNPAEFEFLLQVPRSRISLGHFIAVLAAPSYLLGYWHVTQGLRPASDSWRRIFCGLGFYTFVIAEAWLASRASLASVVRLHASGAIPSTAFAELIDDYHLYSESLVWILRVGVLLVSVLLGALVVQRRTRYPRWFAGFAPLVVLALVFVSLLIAEPIGRFLVPAAMNVAHVVFFGTSTWLLSTAQSSSATLSPST